VCAIEGLGALGTGFAFALLPLIGVFGAELVNNIDGNNEQAIRDWGCVTLAAYGIGSGVGAGWVGRAQGWNGSPGWTCGLAIVPPLVSAGLLYLHFNEPYSGYGRAGVILTAVGSPVLAVVSYNIRASSDMYGGSPGRFLLPSVATRMVGSPETGTSICFDARLVSVRF
jgi:hypothetical protein